MPRMRRCPATTTHNGRTTPCPNLTTHRYCPTHQTTYEQTRGTARQRGYTTAHDHERARLTPHVQAGTTHCTRCGKPIEPGQAWDLGHTDDRTTWTGPEHATCNRRDGGRKGAATRNG